MSDRLTLSGKMIFEAKLRRDDQNKEKSLKANVFIFFSHLIEEVLNILNIFGSKKLARSENQNIDHAKDTQSGNTFSNI